MAPYFSILAWRIPWTEVPGRLFIVPGVAESDTTERASHSHSLLRIPLSHMVSPEALGCVQLLVDGLDS